MTRRKAQPRADHQKACRGQPTSWPRARHHRCLPASGDRRIDLAPLACPIRRHEGKRRQAAQRARIRERAPEKAACRSRARQGHAQGAGCGKILTPGRRRSAVCALTERFGVSERRACRLAGQNRSTQRFVAKRPSDDDKSLRAFLRSFARARPRWGWRRAAKQARREGHSVNDKRIQRLWREEGLEGAISHPKAPLARDRHRNRGDVSDCPQRGVGMRFPVRHHRRRPHHQAAQHRG